MPVPSDAPALTLLVPIFNEQECIPHLHDVLNDFLSQVPVPATVLFVNDGSTDDSPALLRAITAQDPRYALLSLSQNQGLSTALKAGIDHTTTSLVGYIDADLQTSPLDMIPFLEFIPEYDLVNGIRAKRQDKLVKRLSSLIANGVRRALINDGIKDTGCPLKLMKIEYARRLPLFHGMHRFLGALVQLQGGRVRQVAVPHYPRYAGTAKYTLLNRLWKPLVDTFGYRWVRSRWRNYGVAEFTPARAAPVPASPAAN